MDIRDFFQKSIQLIKEGNTSALPSLSLDKPEYFNWVEDIFYPLNVLDHGESMALLWRYKEQTKSYTFKEVYERANQLINFLRKHGAQQGDRMYTVLPLIPENWFSFLATIKGGYIITPTATNLSQHDMAYRFNSLLPEIIIANYDQTEKIDAAEKDYGSAVKIKIVVGGDREGWYSIEDVYQESTEANPTNTKADEPVLYFFTSGTTGNPKIVVHTHFTYPFGHLTTSSWLGCVQGDIHYNISSPGWAKFAWSSFFAPWNTGATIFANQVDGFDPEDQLEAMERFGVTTFCGSPTVIRMLIQKDLSKYDLKLRQCCAAGEPLNPDVIDKWTKSSGVTIRDGYGQTETTALIGNLPEEEIKPGSMGKPTFQYQVGIYDEEGNELPLLEEGIIAVQINDKRHNGVFIEYLNDPKRTSQTFTDGLYLTGDKAYKDEDGYFWFVGRSDDIIKASAYRIGPFEVESVLIEHPSVVESAVVASPHELRGYAVKAYVMLKEGIEPSQSLAEELFAFTEERLAKYKIPRIIEFPESLPKTISGKIRRIELRASEADNRIKKKEVANEYFHRKY